MKRFVVYFEQINQDCVVVSAIDETYARGKARKVWRDRNFPPRIISVEECEAVKEHPSVRPQED